MEDLIPFLLGLAYVVFSAIGAARKRARQSAQARLPEATAPEPTVRSAVAEMVARAEALRREAEAELTRVTAKQQARASQTKTALARLAQPTRLANVGPSASAQGVRRLGREVSRPDAPFDFGQTWHGEDARTVREGPSREAAHVADERFTGDRPAPVRRFEPHAETAADVFEHVHGGRDSRVEGVRPRPATATAVVSPLTATWRARLRDPQAARDALVLQTLFARRGGRGPRA